MKNQLIFIFIILFCAANPAFAQTGILERKITIQFDELNIEEALDEIALSANIYFSYGSNLFSSDKKLNLNAFQQPLKEILNEIFFGENIVFIEFGDQIILREKEYPEKFLIKGTIYDDIANVPISYSTVELRGSRTGTIADFVGYFELEITSNNLSDTLVFSALGYEQVMIFASTLIEGENHKIFMSRKVFEIPVIAVKAKNIKKVVLGNNRRIAIGSLYMDTHGQQTALYIKNKKKIDGKIKSVKYYLSGKGNTDAPFRVRIYEKDSVSNKPGKDLLPQMLVVKPDKRKGWFKIDVSEFNIKIPSDGFFVAFEGVFPNDYDYYMRGKDFKDISDLEDPDKTDLPTTISYGQRLGYSGKKSNNTWHFSLSHTWFQLKRRNFNVMISAEIIIYK